MKALGYQIALDDFQLSKRMDVLLALAIYGVSRPRVPSLPI